jgi:alpha-glucosidase
VTLTDRAVSDRAAATADWWRDAVIYQIYLRSFADSDGDGVGDLPGITARLDHLVDLGVDALWLTPFYPSPQVDMGYDVADYCDVDPLFGTLSDVDALLARAHRLGLRVIVDIVPNHCSSAHPRFAAALAAGPGSSEREWFIFRDGRGPGGAQPPNDWPGTEAGAAWTRVVAPDGTPEQWYLHLFDAAQPDWNWENPAVADMFDDVLRFWLDRGIDGFRVDVSHGMVKAPGLPDMGPRSWNQVIPTVDPATRPPMWDQDGVHEIHRRWRTVVDEYDGRVLVAEAWLDPRRGRLYVRPDEMHQSFNFAFLVSPWRAADLRATIDESLAADGSVGAPTTWVLSNHDVIRHASRLGYPADATHTGGIGLGDPQPDRALGLCRARAATTLMLALPGGAYLYQGEELGLPEVTDLPDESRTDYIWFASGGTNRGRDGCRVPLPWVHDAPSFGFGPGPKSWLPQPAWFARHAVDIQRGLAGSTLELYRLALRLRRELGLGHGDVVWLETPPDVLGVRRGAVTVLTNTGSGAVQVPVPAGSRRLLDSTGEHTGAPVESPTATLPPDTTWWLAPDRR